MISNMLRFPFSMLNNDMERFFYPELFLKSERNVRSVYPPINIGTTDNSVDVYIFIPGMNIDALDIVIEKNMLSVSGARKLPEVANENKDGYRQERFEGRFKRVITLPESVDTDNAEAVYRDGVLHVSIAKRAEAQPRQIKISVH